MTDQTGGSPVGSLSQVRQRTIDALMEHFANDAFEVEEFERRLDVAHAANTTQALNDLLKDLSPAPLPAVHGSQQTAPAPRTRSNPVSAVHPKEKEVMLAVMGGGGRKGSWAPARTNYAVAIMGGQEIDFREAILPPGVTEVQVYTMCGGVEILVPPDLNVESHGLAIMGGFEHVAESGGPLPDPQAPTLRITGVALMGGVDVKVRYPGESAREARQRRRIERKRRKLLGRGGDGGI